MYSLFHGNNINFSVSEDYNNTVCADGWPILYDTKLFVDYPQLPTKELLDAEKKAKAKAEKLKKLKEKRKQQKMKKKTRLKEKQAEVIIC